MDLLGDIGSFGDGSGGDWTVSGGAPAGGYDAGALGQYQDTSQGMPAIDAGTYGTNYATPGALTTEALQGTPSTPADYTTTTAPSGSGGLGYGTGGLGFTNSQAPAAAAPQSTVAKMLKLPTNSSGATDWTNPQTIINLTKALTGGAGMLGQLLNHGKQVNAQSGQQLLAGLQANAHNTWNPTQQAVADQFFNQRFTPAWQRPAMPSGMPIVPSRGYAEGGDVDGDGGNQQGPLGLVSGDGMGQADDVPVNLSGGEYIFPADVVSDLGDGNNAAGAKVLDEWVQEIRKRSRSTGPEDNPPEAHEPAAYLKGGQQ